MRVWEVVVRSSRARRSDLEDVMVVDCPGMRRSS